jgi:hypothetical protein
MQIKDKEGKVIYEGELTEAELEKAILSSKTSEQEKVNLVNELKDQRKARQFIEDENKVLKAENEKLKTGSGGSNSDDERAQKVVRLVLEERDKAESENNKKIAFEQFKNRHKEFHPDTDTGGVKWSLLEAKMRKFDTSSLKTTQDFIEALNDAYALLRNQNDGGERFQNPYSSSPSNSSSFPKEVDPNNLTARELKLIQDNYGGDKKRYLKIKEKYPVFVDSLLRGNY